MGKCCGKKPAETTSCNPCCPPAPTCGGGKTREGALGWFDQMVDHCYAYAEEANSDGRPIVGIMCEYTPREIIMAAGGVPVCLCGGSNEMVAPAENDLPSNLCPLIKSTYGYHLEKSNPFLEMASLIVAETTCDGKKKMYELMGETRPMHVLELPQKQDDPAAFDHWLHEIKGLKTALEERFGVTITDDDLRGAITTMNRERALRRKLAELMQAENPPMTGSELLDCKSIISGICADLEQYQKVYDEISARSDAANKDKVRVLMTGVPIPHGAERVLNMIEDNGGLVVAMENCSGLKPIINDVDADAADPLRAIAEHYYYNIPCSVMTKNERRLDLLRALHKDYRPDCIIELIWQACLTYDVESFRVKTLAAELGVPYLRIETDYSPSDSARIAVRIEALFETVQN